MRISGKNLGELALPNACPRCFWIKQHLKQLPYSIFPGIFSTLDSFTKRCVHGVFDDTGKAPIWLQALGDVVGYIEPPHHNKFLMTDEKTGVVLSGAADGILKKADGSYIIVDYKTARFTEYQDHLLPMYEVQLNAYAMIAESLGMSPVLELALIYFDPTFSLDDIMKWPREYGFDMGFEAKVLKIDQRPEIVKDLLVKAQSICQLPSPPKGIHGCKNCVAVNSLVRSVTKK